ncbi:molybdopterin-dependent oxidoreductase [Novosphingobium sp. KCTC 2891]|uniref:molybdopterin-dependent oxidoreductase n=1 Tax=Novosphingobium sp. KCTC 2891 TaxID=2989730 RepID=UPI002223B470|nr:molybdopterin-dependent oxidoreductase [Novosphingobium sp. KCTC 2891]MCW1384082.1 molybdopterin-dependent oxidoreductase [Novosphingobium sp. KCTC 2891]
MKHTYSAAHWGIYEVDPQPEGAPVLRPLSADPDPTRIGLDQLSPEVRRLRIARPAVRKGWLEGRSRDGRGGEPFVEIDWDEALDLVAGEITRVRTDWGNRAIFAGSYGWASAGRFHHAQSQLHRFYNCLGGYARSVDSYSLGAGRVLMPHIAVDMDSSNASHTSWDVLEDHCTLFVSFGGVPLKNTQVSSSGAGRHRARAGLAGLASAGVRIVNIGPVGDNLEAGAGVEWIPLRPNTDTALMLALAHAVYHDPAFDRAFIDSHTVGFDRFVPYLVGTADGVAKSPEWAEPITGVPAAATRALAAAMLRNRTMLNAAWALQRAAHGEQPFWALVTLAAMLGQIGLPGGGYGLGYGAMNVMGSAHVRIPGPVFPQGRNAVADFIPCARLADMLLHPGEPFRYNGGEHRYPDIKLVHWAGGNPFHHHQDLNRLRRAWARPETIVVHEQYWNAAARHADIVLPASTALERNDIGFATREGYYIAMKQAMAPQGEARSDHAILAGVAERLGVAEAFGERRDEMAWLRQIYESNRARVGETGLALPDFDAFWEQGLIDLAPHDAPHVMHADFRADAVAHPLPTPSGRIEIFSERIAGFGLGDCPGHPVWREPFEWLGGAEADRFPLHLISDQPERRLHSQLDPSPWSRAGKVAGREGVHIHPADAAARGIGDGDVVELFNDRGRCLAGAVLNERLLRGVVRLSTGAWYDPDGMRDRHGNPNVLTLDRGSSELSQGCSAHSCLVDLRKWTGEAPPVRAFDLPRI